MKKGDEKMKKFIKEFKDFALKGNMIDMAVAVIIGGAFSGIVNSLIENVINPILNFFMIGARYTNSDLSGFASNFLGAIINFLLMALILFCIVKAVSKLMAIGKKEEAEEPTTKKCPYCLSEIPIEATRCPHCTSILKEGKAIE